MKKILSVAIALGCAQQIAFADEPVAQGVKSTVQIKANTQQVWDAVHHERSIDPDLSYSKVIEQKGNRILLEQKFNSIPVVGDATCLLVQEETLHKRIDYKMVKSDKFKEMFGSWTLEEKPGGITALSLHSVLDTGLPFSQGMVNSTLKGKIEKRLERVKVAAEAVALKSQKP